jgi:hypothetical protein
MLAFWSGLVFVEWSCFCDFIAFAGLGGEVIYMR